MSVKIYSVEEENREEAGENLNSTLFWVTKGLGGGNRTRKCRRIGAEGTQARKGRTGKDEE